MRSRFLFPHQWRLIGYLCFAADILFAIILKILYPHGFASTDLHQVPGSATSIHQAINGIDPGFWLSHDVTILLIIFVCF